MVFPAFRFVLENANFSRRAINHDPSPSAD